MKPPGADVLDHPARQRIEVKAGRHPDWPAVLRPYDRREALTVKEAAELAGTTERTVRNWCAAHFIGRRVVGRWAVSRVALQMLLDGNDAALNAYVDGNRESEMVRIYFERAGLGDLIR